MNALCAKFKKHIVDLIEWLTNRFNYALFFCNVYLKSYDKLYSERKPQAFIIFFYIVSVFALLFCFCMFSHISFGNSEHTGSENVLCAIFELIALICSFIAKAVFSLANAWVRFISQGSNLAVIIGVVITFYCFLFNAQKNTASASTTFSDWRIKTFLVFLMFPNFLKLLGWEIGKEKLPESFNSLFFPLILLSVFWIGTWFIIHSFNMIYRVNVINLFDYVLFSYDLYRCGILLFLKPKELPLANKINEYTQEKLFDGFNHVILSVYQILLFFTRNELLGVLQQNYKKWKDLCAFLNFDELENDQNSESVHFVEEYPVRYLAFYKTIIRCQYMLIRDLYERGYVAEGHTALIDFFSMCPYQNAESEGTNNISEELTEEFLSSLCEISLFFYNNNISLSPFFENCKYLVNLQNINDIIALYRILLIKASEKQDVKIVISLCYSLIQLVDQATQVKDLYKAEFDEISGNNERYLGRVLYIYMCVIIKSFELGYKDVVAFLIKFIVSEYDSVEVEKVLHHLHIQLPRDEKFDNHKIGNHIGILGFNINSKTYKYCFEKMAILLYGQQKYMNERGVSINKKMSGVSTIDSYLTDNYLYVFDKLCTDNYNLLWIKEGKVFNVYRDELKKKLFMRRELEEFRKETM